MANNADLEWLVVTHGTFYTYFYYKNVCITCGKYLKRS